MIASQLSAGGLKTQRARAASEDDALAVNVPVMAAEQVGLAKRVPRTRRAEESRGESRADSDSVSPGSAA